MDKLLALLAESQHEELAARESRLLMVLAQEYTGLYGRLGDLLDEMAQVMELAQSRGERITLNWLYRHARLRNLLDQVALQLREYNGVAEHRLTEGQREMVALAQYHARRLIEVSAGTPPLSRKLPPIVLPKGAIEQFAGRIAHDGSPLRKTLRLLPSEAQSEVRRSITTGIALGQSPRKVAGQMKRKLDGTLYQYLRIARTEQLSAYRAASLSVYEANGHILHPEWKWLTPKDERVCSFCAGQSGKVFPISVPFSTHPQCRCTPLPQTKSWAEILGLTEHEMARLAA